MNPDGDDLNGPALFEVIKQQFHCPAFERQMARTQRAGAFRKNEQLAARSQEPQTVFEGVRVDGPVALVFGPRHRNPVEEDAAEEILAELSRNHEYGSRQK